MDVLIQDVRYALRSLGRARAFTAVVIVVMGLGIGVNALLFSLLYGVLLRPWPLPQNERVCAVETTEPARGLDEMGLSWQDFSDLRARQKSFSSFGGYWQVQTIVTIDRDPERFDGLSITSDLLPALGVLPVLGRNFTHDEEIWGRNWNQVIISDRIWRQRFGGDPHVLGRTLRLNGRTRAIVGVLPPDVRFPETQDFFIPAGFDAASDVRTDNLLEGIGRLAPGVTITQARAEMSALMNAIARDHPEMKGFGVSVVNAQDRWARNVRAIMMTMLVAVVFVLLIACANVANLMLARGAGRRREIGMRMAVGATRGRIVRQLVTESVLLAGFGALLGLVLAHYGLLLVARAIPMEKPYFMRFDLGGPVLLYTLVVTVVAAVAFGLAPAIHAADARLIEALREGSVQSGSSPSQRRMRNALVVAEIALSLVLLVGAGLMIRTVQRFEHAGESLRTDGLVTGHVLLPIATFPGDADRTRFFRSLTARLRELPGVTEVSGASQLPLSRNNSSMSVLTPGHEDPHRALIANIVFDLPGSLAMLGIPMIEGREISAADDEHSRRVVVVSRSLATRLWPNGDALGQRLRFAGEPDSLGWRTVVGVCSDMVQNVEATPARGSDARYAVYVAEYQQPDQYLGILVRSRGGEKPGADALRRAVHDLDADVAVTELRSLREELRFALWLKRFFAGLIGIFGSTALVIAAVGLYGVMAYSVSQRTQEIGIRMALGADAAGVQRMVVGNALRLTAIGVAIGLAGALAVTRFMTAGIQGVSPTDPPTFTLVTLLLVGSGLIAAWVPSIRATRVDPMRALRAE
ncbi:MAG TPA: ABC transporter permease [Candidatus Acidoferrales bacterium]|nr:ABC transporter permease [Candidatus Acidoferrales bacterium]